MESGFLNCLVSAIAGAAAAVGVTWYMATEDPNGGAAAKLPETIKARKIEVDSLVVGDSVLLVNPKTREATLELRDGSVYAKNCVFAENLGGYKVLAQKVQTTTHNPLDLQSPVFGELAVNADGGAYLALLSPKETHSLTMGFDKNEKGCVVSQNNDDMSMVAQAVFLKPTQNRGGIAPASGVESPRKQTNQPATLPTNRPNQQTQLAPQSPQLRKIPLSDFDDEIPAALPATDFPFDEPQRTDRPRDERPPLISDTPELRKDIIRR